ncbi:MAG: sulfatase [Gemmatimonadaceae bacterium]
MAAFLSEVYDGSLCCTSGFATSCWLIVLLGNHRVNASLVRSSWIAGVDRRARRVVAVFLAASCASAPPEASPPPNVLFIAVDDLRPALGAYGDSIALSPNIDRLARDGAIFLDAHAQQAVCNPSRASLMTGLRPDSLRVWDLDTDFRVTTPGVVTLPQFFMRHGYHALSVGKIYHNVLPDTASWSEPELHVDGFPFDPDAVYHHRDNLAIQEQRKAAIIRAGTQAHSVDKYGLWYLKANATESVDAPDSVYYDGAQTNLALRTLDRLKRDGKPFFFGIGFYRPHLPFNAPQRYWDLYDRNAIPLPSPAHPPDGAPIMAMSTMRELRGYADFANAVHPFDGSLTEAEIRRLRHGYYASVSYIDAQVGRLLDHLDSLGLAENTIVVLWGDHGYKIGELNGWAKMTNYMIDTHSPLLVRAPGRIRPQTRVSQMVEFVDVYPTLAELAGLPVPAELQGTSAVSLLKDPTIPWKPAIFSQFLRSGMWVAPDSQPYMGYSVLTDSLHYVKWINWDTRREVARELYDRRADPDETRNLATLPSSAAILDSMERLRVAGWRAARPRAR